MHRFDVTVDLDLDGRVDYVGGYDTSVHWHKNRGDGLVAAALLRKCCRGGTLPEADAADVLMERLAACDDPTTLAAFCRAAHASAAARRAAAWLSCTAT